MAKKAVAAKPLTKTQILNELSERTGMTKKEVADFFDVLEQVIAENIGAKGPGAFTIPGLLKIVKRIRKKQPAKKGINPRTGEEIMIAAKPERKVVKVTALKKLKEMV
ncbi:integration host factor subunit alpha [Thalassoglobus neptunius]|uniref:Viral histone-like protein n=1 Tax=Thalassoglobus neptunius TaxID=1938619 RepID=A0A5C5WP56_9PLAN|nr:HU family DNA-binding protein [Thalassoglobus neptunius]TWT52025.1 integration host factor subunit alpha [Thalassoglobus neptunius]